MPDPSLDPAKQLEMLESNVNQGGGTVAALEAPLPVGGNSHAAAPEAVSNAPVLPVAPAKSSAFLINSSTSNISINMPNLQRGYSLRSMQSAATADTRFQSQQSKSSLIAPKFKFGITKVERQQ
jgi:hypothetical protein